MSTGPKRNHNEALTGLPEWEDCDFFCIHDYAGTGASPCGWRGRLQAARPAETNAKLLCPRCGCTTLLRIPLRRAEKERS